MRDEWQWMVFKRLPNLVVADEVGSARRAKRYATCGRLV